MDENNMGNNNSIENNNDANGFVMVDNPAPQASPVSYTHLTLPTILRV